MQTSLVQCRSWEEAEVHVAALQSRIVELANRLRDVEKQLDTLGSPWWKRIWFRMNGWPAWWITDQPRRWRPWQWLTDRWSR